MLQGEKFFSQWWNMRSLSLCMATLVCLCAEPLARADSRPDGRHPDVAHLPKAAVQLYADTTLFPRSTKWLSIPWLVDLNEAMRTAKDEGRPIVIWVSGDDPLERC